MAEKEGGVDPERLLTVGMALAAAASGDHTLAVAAATVPFLQCVGNNLTFPRWRVRRVVEWLLRLTKAGKDAGVSEEVVEQVAEQSAPLIAEISDEVIRGFVEEIFLRTVAEGASHSERAQAIEASLLVKELSPAEALLFRAMAQSGPAESGGWMDCASPGLPDALAARHLDELNGKRLMEGNVQPKGSLQKEGANIRGRLQPLGHWLAGRLGWEVEP